MGITYNLVWVTSYENDSGTQTKFTNVGVVFATGKGNLLPVFDVPLAIGVTIKDDPQGKLMLIVPKPKDPTQPKTPPPDEPVPF